MFELLGNFWTSLFAFLLVLTVLVFVHEMGHYWAARQCSVRVETFSVGFGPEIFGKTSVSGTRWKLSAIPFGGYVKMYGEKPPTQGDDKEGYSHLNLEQSFFNKPLWQRAWIVFAGPLANLLFAILVLAVLFISIGEPHTPANIAKVGEGTAAERAGLRAGDIFLKIDDHDIKSFEDVRRIVQSVPGRNIRITVNREGSLIELTAVPETVREERFGSIHVFGRLGVSRGNGDTAFVKHNPFSAFYKATVQTGTMAVGMLKAIKEIILGQRTPQELGGPIKIAQMSGEMAQAGFIVLAQFVVILSINLGIINLLPVPLLDGGHLTFYLLEALRGKPVGDRAMGVCLNIGFFLLIMLTVFVTWNDLLQTSIGKLFTE